MIFKRKNKIEKINPKTDNFKEPKNYHEAKKIYSIALVLDNEVQDIIRTEERLCNVNEQSINNRHHRP